MHYWRLLIVAFLALFHPIAGFTDPSLVDGREQCCDPKPHRDTRLYGKDIRGKSSYDNRLLNQARSERRYVVRDSSVLSRPAPVPEQRLSTRIDSHRGYRFERVIKNQRLTRDNSQRSEPRDTRIARRIRNSENVRSPRQLDVLHAVRENNHASSSRLRDTTTENRCTLASNELQRIRQISRENNRISNVRDTRDILQRTRDDLTRSVQLNYRSDERLLLGRLDGQRNVQSRIESRDVAGDERRYIQRSKSRFSVQSEEANKFDSRASSRQHLYNNQRSRSSDRTENHRVIKVRDYSDVRRSMTRSAFNENTRRPISSDNSDRRLYRNDNQRISSVSRNERSENKRERDILACDERRVSTSDERRFESRIEKENRERRSVSLTDRRLMRETRSANRQRYIREDSPMSRERFERHQTWERKENYRSELRTRTSELKYSTRSIEARNRQVEKTTNSGVTRDISRRDVSRNRDSFERRTNRSTSTDRLLNRELTRQIRQNREARETEQKQMENHREMSRNDIHYRVKNVHNRDLVMSSPKSYDSHDQVLISNWQHLIYTIQAIYLCSILFNMLNDNGANKGKTRFSWWIIPSQNLVKLD